MTDVFMSVDFLITMFQGLFNLVIANFVFSSVFLVSLLGCVVYLIKGLIKH